MEYCDLVYLPRGFSVFYLLKILMLCDPERVTNVLGLMKNTYDYIILCALEQNKTFSKQFIRVKVA